LALNPSIITRGQARSRGASDRRPPSLGQQHTRFIQTSRSIPRYAALQPPCSDPPANRRHGQFRCDTEEVARAPPAQTNRPSTLGSPDLEHQDLGTCSGSYPNLPGPATAHGEGLRRPTLREARTANCPILYPTDPRAGCSRSPAEPRGLIEGLTVQPPTTW